MASKLEIAEQVKIAGELALRCEMFYETWIAIAARESRTKYRDALEAHLEILMSIQGAHMFALACALHSLFERKDRLNLPTLSALADNVAADQLAKSADVARKVEKLRHNLYAHRSGSLTTAEIFRLAEITPNELRFLTNRASAIVRIIAAHLDLPAPPQATGAQVVIQNLLDAVARDTIATWNGAPDPFA